MDFQAAVRIRASYNAHIYIFHVFLTCCSFFHLISYFSIRITDDTPNWLCRSKSSTYIQSLIYRAYHGCVSCFTYTTLINEQSVSVSRLNVELKIEAE